MMNTGWQRIKICDRMGGASSRKMAERKIWIMPSYACIHEYYRKKTDPLTNPYLESPLGHQLSSKPERKSAKTASIDCDDGRKSSS
jgi:hypothetical protein